MESWEQWVRPQKRPPQEAGAVMVLDSPFWSAKPVVDIAGIPALDRMPGHTVYSHLFIIVKVVEITPKQKQLWSVKFLSLKDVLKVRTLYVFYTS